MPSSSEIRAGKAYVELSLRDKLGQGLLSAEKKLKSLGSSLTNIGTKLAGIGAAGLAGLGAAANVFASMGDAVNKASQRTGVAVETLTSLKYAAEQSAVSFEDLEKGLTKMQKGLIDAAGGSKGAIEAFTAIGLSVSDLLKLSPDEQLKAIAEKISLIEDPAARAAASMELFGKSGAGLLPLFADGAKGIADLQKRAEELGLTFGKEDAEAATKFGDILGDLWSQLKAVTFQAGAAVATALQPFAEATASVLAAVIGWMKENRGLVVTVLAISGAVVGAGIALAGLGVVVSAIGAGLGVLGTILAALPAIIATVGTVIAALTGPVAIVTAAVAAAGYAFIQFSGIGAKITDFLGAKFIELKETAKLAFGGIVDALSSGDFALAGTILWKSLAVAWREGTQELREMFYDWKGTIMTGWEDMTTGLANFWDAFVGGISDKWAKAQNILTKGIDYIKGLWDGSFDVDAANAAADQLLDKQKNDRAKVENDRATGRQAENDKNQAERDANSKAELGKLDEMKKELVDLRTKASDQRAAKDAKTEEGGKDKPTIDLEDILNNKKSLETPEAKANKGLSAGVFNAAALNSLNQGGGTFDRIARATERTEKNTKKLVDAGGLRW